MKPTEELARIAARALGFDLDEMRRQQNRQREKNSKEREAEREPERAKE